MPYANSYNKRKIITINKLMVSGSSDITDFVMLFKSRHPDFMRSANGGYVENSNGYDIIFETFGGVQLDHEIENYNGDTGEFIAWVRIPTLYYNALNEFFIYIGNAAISVSQEDIVGVWESSFKAVHHLRENPGGSAPQMLDSTNNNYDLTSGGSMVAGDLVAGKINKAIDFDGSDDYLVNTAWASVISGNAARTMEIWFKISGTPNFNALSWGAAGGNQLSSFGCYGNEIGYTGYANDNLVPGTPYADNVFHQMVITHDGSTMKIFIDGIERRSDNPESIATSTGADLYLGRYVAGSYFPGQLAESRIHSVARNPDYVLTNFRTMNSPESFYSLEDRDKPGNIGRSIAIGNGMSRSDFAS